MQARFLLGPAGSGKTFRCVAEIRARLAAEPEGPPLLLLAPKQTTFQLESQLLAGPEVAGYTRLRILSFDRLALFVFDQLGRARPQMLDDEGRLMVLRSLITRRREGLELFRASARLAGFAQHLSQALRELQRHQLTPESLLELAERTETVEGLSRKLRDLATLLRDYLDWLSGHDLQDAEHLLDAATAALRAPHGPLDFGELWVDGFTELSPQELELLAAVVPQTSAATITFCLDQVPGEKVSWLSNWSVVRRAYARCHRLLAGLPGCELTTEMLPRQSNRSRFAEAPALRHLEKHWNEPRPFHEPAVSTADGTISEGDALRIAGCATPEAEAVLAAREIVRFVRRGGRYRETTVLTRDLGLYHDVVVGVFARYGIPCFLDRRESVAHHPLAELTRNALRTVAYQWQTDDWFAALKTGMTPAADEDIDRLENEALARGWKGRMWQSPITLADDPQLAAELEAVRLAILPPFQKLAQRMGLSRERPTGTELAGALREFWGALRVEDTLQSWADRETSRIHLTVWQQMGAWLDNVELAFPAEPLPLKDWLPILDAGLANLTVGVIPPALDQVLIGAIDRSRNPDIRLALVLGMNETIFPAAPRASVLLTETDRQELEKQGILLNTGARHQLGQERFHGYVACTRARERLVLTYSFADVTGKPLNPSPFLTPLRQMFPTLAVPEVSDRHFDWRESEHPSELVAPLLRQQLTVATGGGRVFALDELPGLGGLRERLQNFTAAPSREMLSPAMAERLYGRALRTSVSRMEQFAACPFKFFVHSGLRAQERKLFELDVREQGSFQHEILQAFHEQVRAGGRRWRDLTAEEAREKIRVLAAARTLTFRDGLLQSNEQGKFTARVLAGALQDFVETLTGWMRQQYAFDPAEVELPFGDDDPSFPAWELDLGEGRRLLLHGRIDRVDLCPGEKTGEALCVVVDYKSSQKQLDQVMLDHGLQLQLPAYLNVLRRWPNAQGLFGVARLVPAGVFYVNLRGRYEREDTRDDALADPARARRLAYRHTGRFDAGALPKLDQRPDALEGDQFNYRRRKDGSLNVGSREAMPRDQFNAMLDHVETALRRMGAAVYAGTAAVDPYRKGTATACEQCDYRTICRIDPWHHTFRVLRKTEAVEGQVGHPRGMPPMPGATRRIAGN